MSVDHAALVFGTDDELVAGSRDLIETGLVEGDLLLVLGDDQGLPVLREAWGNDPRIKFGEAADFYEHPMRTMAELQRVLDREGTGGHRVRVTGPVPFEKDPRLRRGWMRYEALVDRAFAPYGLTSVCQYDTRVVGDDLIDHARATHARVVTTSGEEPGGGRRAQVLADLARVEEPDPMESTPAVYEDMLVGAGDLARVRTGFSPAPADLVLAVGEVVTNALQHGGPPVTVRLHHEAGRWLGVVTDHGPGLRDPYAGVDSPLPGNPEPAGRGLWAARQLCDELLIVCRDGAGTTVRLIQHA